MAHFRRPKLVPIVIAIVAMAFIGLALYTSLLWRQLSTNTEKASTLSLDSSTFAIKKGTDVTATIQISSEEPIDTVTATINYDASQLAYKSIDNENSPFGSYIPPVVKDDTVTVQVAKLGGETVKGDVKVASVTFTSLKDDNANLKISEGNAANDGIATNPQLQFDTNEKTTVWLFSAITTIVFIVLLGLLWNILRTKVKKKRAHHEVKN
ncbi:MAG: hypothetical protein JWO54_285 [Candidatus Saccharibacteria bacterium]|nr:hypothetical protein [Candidatus Saccharibacteria bacterium]MDB5180527.1 hypothetical protein [Candidatus Saccharibacteria bacterium]